MSEIFARSYYFRFNAAGSKRRTCVEADQIEGGIKEICFENNILTVSVYFKRCESKSLRKAIVFTLITNYYVMLIRNLVWRWFYAENHGGRG